MEIVCKNCNTSHYLSDDRIPLETKTGKCKQCSAPMTVLGKNALGSIELSLTQSTPPEQEATKNCDFCGEKILAIAKKCRHCSSMLDGSHAAESQGVAEQNTPPSTPPQTKNIWQWINPVVNYFSEKITLLQGATNFNESFSSYDQVPWYRKRWFAITSFILFNPALVFILFTGNGEIYYEGNGRVKKLCSKGEKIVLRILSLLYLLYLLYLLWIWVFPAKITIPVVPSTSSEQSYTPSIENQPNATEQTTAKSNFSFLKSEADVVTTAIQDRDGVAYLPNSDTPFTGKYELPHYRNGQKQGVIIYKDGKLDGLLTKWYENGQKKAEATFEDGKFDGLSTTWYENGRKKAEETFKDGNKYGLSMGWYANGQKQVEIAFKDGKQNGLLTAWYDDGQKKSEVNFKDGNEEGLSTEWHENGQKKSEANFKNGSREGLSTEWYENGQKKIEVNFKNGKPDGLHTRWDEHGQKDGEANFKDGKIDTQWDQNGKITFKDGKYYY